MRRHPTNDQGQPVPRRTIALLVVPSFLVGITGVFGIPPPPIPPPPIPPPLIPPPPLDPKPPRAVIAPRVVDPASAPSRPAPASMPYDPTSRAGESTPRVVAESPLRAAEEAARPQWTPVAAEPAAAAEPWPWGPDRGRRWGP